MDVIPITLKNVVFLEANFYVQIARGATVGAGLSVACAADAHATIDAGWNFDFQGLLAFDFALATAGDTRLWNDFAVATAGGAGLLHAEKTLPHLDRT
jgi:hypothetical protein